MQKYSTNSPHYVTRALEPFSFMDIGVSGSNLYTETNVEYTVNFIKPLPSSTNYPRIELKVQASDGNDYLLILEDCTLQVAVQGHYGFLYVRGKYLQKLDIVKAKEDVGLLYQTDYKGRKVEALSYKVANTSAEFETLCNASKIHKYIHSDTWAWDFSYLESLLDKMSDKELDKFCEVNYARSKEQKLT